MADIIPLRPGARAARSAPPSEGAQILFFLGVRYCRVEEPEQPQRGKARRAKTPREAEGARKRGRGARA